MPSCSETKRTGTKVVPPTIIGAASVSTCFPFTRMFFSPTVSSSSRFFPVYRYFASRFIPFHVSPQRFRHEPERHVKSPFVVERSFVQFYKFPQNIYVLSLAEQNVRKWLVGRKQHFGARFLQPLDHGSGAGRFTVINDIAFDVKQLQFRAGLDAFERYEQIMAEMGVFELRPRIDDGERRQAIGGCVKGAKPGQAAQRSTVSIWFMLISRDSSFVSPVSGATSFKPTAGSDSRVRFGNELTVSGCSRFGFCPAFNSSRRESGLIGARSATRAASMFNLTSPVSPLNGFSPIGFGWGLSLARVKSANDSSVNPLSPRSVPNQRAGSYPAQAYGASASGRWETAPRHGFRSNPALRGKSGRRAA